MSWWRQISQWCQEYLGLADGQLDSLWYERLAEAAVQVLAEIGVSPAILELYEKSLSLPNPSWLSYKGLGEERFRQQEVKEAITSIEKALECAEAPESSPTPKPEDIIKLNLLLGDYNYEASALDKAVDHYTSACHSDDAALARKAQVGQLKVRMCSPDAEAARQLLRETLCRGGSEAHFVSILKELARDDNHDAIITKMFTVAKIEESLFKEIVHALETASAAPSKTEQPRTDLSPDDRFSDYEARGVLLYARGLAANTYKITPTGSEPRAEAVRLWKECCEQLAHVGGPRAYATRDAASTALSKCYFQSMTEGKHSDYLSELQQLVETESRFAMSKPAGFLGALHSGRQDTERSLKSLSHDMKLGLQLLSDNHDDNDFYGFDIIYNSLLRFGDFENAIIALSLRGQPDLVSEELYFGTDPSKQIGRKVSQAAKSQVPDSEKQLERIQAAKEHVKAFLENSGPEAADEVTTDAYKDIQTKLEVLYTKHTPKQGDFELTGGWWCDGTKEDGRRCPRNWDLQNDVYQCVFCADTIFCKPCFTRLRNPAAEGGADIFACSHKHKWLKVPRVATDMYVGPKGKSIRIPTHIVPEKQGDDKLLEIRYTSDEEISLDTWKEKMAETWGFSLVEIAKEMQRVASPTGQDAD